MNKFENAINNLADQIENGHLLSSINGGCDLLNAAAAKIKELEAERKEIFDLAYTIALANIDDRLVDPINRIAELSKDLGGKDEETK